MYIFKFNEAILNLEHFTEANPPHCAEVFMIRLFDQFILVNKGLSCLT